MDGAGLASGFVLAAIIAAVLFADRIGGDVVLSRRIYQAGLGAIVAFTVVGGTTAFVRIPEIPESFGDSSGFDEEESEQEEYIEELQDRNVTVLSIHTAVGVVLLAAGIALMRRFVVLPLGLMLGGLLLLLFGGPGGSSNDPQSLFTAQYASLLGSYFGYASRAVDIGRFGVLLGATVVLLAVGFSQWERTTTSVEVDREPTLA